MKRISAFHSGCLWMICCIFWPEKISSEDLFRKRNCHNMVLEIQHRRVQCLRHVLRMDQDRICKVALRWTLLGKAKNNPELRAENSTPIMGQGTAYYEGSDQMAAALRSTRSIGSCSSIGSYFIEIDGVSKNTSIN